MQRHLTTCDGTLRYTHALHDMCRSKAACAPYYEAGSSIYRLSDFDGKEKAVHTMMPRDGNTK